MYQKTRPKTLFGLKQYAKPMSNFKVGIHKDKSFLYLQ